MEQIGIAKPDRLIRVEGVVKVISQILQVGKTLSIADIALKEVVFLHIGKLLAGGAKHHLPFKSAFVPLPLSVHREVGAKIFFEPVFM